MARNNILVFIKYDQEVLNAEHNTSI